MIPVRARARLVLLASLALVAIFATTPGRDAAWFRRADPPLYAQTVERMRSQGVDYYRAMNDEMASWLDDRASSVRAFRMPTMFVLWRWLPSIRAIWVVYLLLVALTAALFLRLVQEPLVVPLAVVSLVSNGFNGFTATELWAVPAVAGCLVAWRARRDGLAAGLALVAALIRETAAGLLLGGLLAAWRRKRARWPWIAAIGVAAVAFLLHSLAVRPYLVDEGGEAPLLFTGGLDAVAAMMGVGLPLRAVLGPVLWIAAAVHVWRRDEFRELLAFYLTIPLLGFVVGRPYWGFLTVPFVLLWGVEEIVERVRRVRLRRAPQPAT